MADGPAWWRMSELAKFEGRAPSAQTAVDVFRGRWASDLRPLLGVEGTGSNLLFTQDRRPDQAAAAFGRSDFQGFDILEIGPLEAAHTWLLEKLGARAITCVESSVEAWLKCLVVKEVLGLDRSKFLLGDVTSYLREEPHRFDLVFASGVLYHMADPVELIRAIADATDRCFVWTHVWDPERHPKPFQPTRVEREGIQVTYWSHRYGEKTAAGFWGGLAPTASWMTRDDMLAAFTACGLSDIRIIEDSPDHPNGPALTFTARRPGAGDPAHAQG